MNKTMQFHAAEILPARAEALKNQGISAGDRISPAIEALLSEAYALFETKAAPIGVVSEISKADFEPVYRGAGRNEERTPVGDIHGRAEHLALFAATIGPEIVREIDRRFRSNDLALGAMLDSVASAGADRLAAVIERTFAEQLRAEGRSGPGIRVLRYSPGYCGWHISGQQALFEILRPGRIGITLRDSFLMEPLKSVSGVLIAGDADIHNFRMAYRYCESCAARGCRERIRTLLAG